MFSRVIQMIRRLRHAYHCHGIGEVKRMFARNIYRVLPFASPPSFPPNSHVVALPSHIEENCPENLLAELDCPQDNHFESGGVLHIVGWAWSAHGVEVVGFYLNDGLRNQIAPEIRRPDVLARFQDEKEKGAGALGFAVDLNLAGLPFAQYELAVVVRDHEKNTKIIKKIVRRVPEAAAYHRHYYAVLFREEAMGAIGQELGARFLLVVDAGENADCVETVASIFAQSHGYWSCLVVGRMTAEAKSQWAAFLQQHKGAERISFSDKENLSVAAESNSAELVCFVQGGERLAPHCLENFARCAKANPDAGLFYSDNDCCDERGLHCGHHFKPDWSPDYMLASNYVGGVYCVRKEAVAEKILKTAEPGWRYEIFLNLAFAPLPVHHIPKVLWSAPWHDHLPRRQIEAETEVVARFLGNPDSPVRVLPTESNAIRKILWPLPAHPPKVSVIIPTTGKLTHLRPCVESLVARTNYPAFELVFIDNGRGAHPDGIEYLREKGFRVIECTEAFNWSRLNNIGAKETDGELLLFMNDDVESINDQWLKELVCQAVRLEVGTVGALLLYPDGAIQHAGIFLVDHGGGARHYLHGQHPGEDIYQELHLVAREVSASTGACLLVRRSVFAELKGFDEELPVVGNDVDFCLRAARKGYKNIFTPHCRMVHHESVSRKDTNIGPDEARMWARWKEKFLAGDPYYNPNLAQDRMDHSLDMRILTEPLKKVSGSLRSKGVNVIGYIRAEMGVGEAARGLARAIELGGAPFAIIDYGYGNPSRQKDMTWTHRLSNKPVFDINILHVNADLVPTAFEKLGEDVFKDRYNIGFWAWELPDFPDRWQGAFDLLDEIWTPSTFVQETVAKKSPIPVHCFPHPIEKGPGPYLGRNYFGLPQDSFLFLSMYDIHSIQERKNPKGSIRAFKKAFSPDDNRVGLVIKVNNASQAELAEVLHLIEGYKNIFILDRVLSRYEVDSLIASCDCFVSLHRSEGFGLVLAEAMCLGKPVIATAWSGNMQFMTEANSACVKYELVKLGRDYGPYEACQQWAEPDIDHASWWMRHFREKPTQAEAYGALARKDVSEELSPLLIGKRIQRRIEQISIKI